MLPNELFKKIQGFHFKTRHLANDLFAGRYESAFRGRGMAFAEVRAYEPGDDIRTIDWNVSARFGHPFVKVFHEERELTVMLVLDLSGSNLFGTRRKFKRELLAEVAGMLAFLAVRTNDKVGALLFSSRVEKYILPKKGASHVWRLIKEIFTYEPDDLRTDIHGAMAYLMRVVKRRAIVFLISDFMDSGFDIPLKLAAKKHDLTLVRIFDPAEKILPEVGLLAVKDPESGQTAVINSRSRRLKEAWQAHWHRHEAYLADLCKKAGADRVDIHTAGTVVEPLIRLFDQRRKRL
jgi:uncharacterized protein (DUF58 family)